MLKALPQESQDCHNPGLRSRSLRKKTRSMALVAQGCLRFCRRAVRPLGWGGGRRSEMTQAVVLEEVGKLSLREIDVCEPFTADDVRIDIKCVSPLAPALGSQ